LTSLASPLLIKDRTRGGEVRGGREVNPGPATISGVEVRENAPEK